MEITVKVLGAGLCSAIRANKASLDHHFLKLSKYADVIDIVVEQVEEPLKATDVIASPDQPTVVLVHTETHQFLDHLQALERREMLLAGGGVENGANVCPVIMVFTPGSPLNEFREFPELVSDWFFMPVAPAELARRVLYALRRKSILKSRMCYGPMTLIPESRSILFGTRSATLTRSEFALAELFLSQLGSVIPTADLVALFKSTGKSTEGSNIRVTVFQLRLKLEMLTKSQYTLVSVYKQGYCLKQKVRPTGVEDRPRTQAQGAYRVAAGLL